VELTGKIAIVTGGARGIGAAIARDLAKAGAKVIINYRSSAESAEALAAEIDGKAVQADVSTTAGCEALVAVAIEAGGLHIVVNNAGICDDGLAMRLRDSQWDDVMHNNAGGTFKMCRAALPAMAKARDGAIINIASVSGIRGNAGQANYSASKAAVIGLTRALAVEMARRNVRVNAVCPGFIATDMTADLPAKAMETAMAAIPMGRMGRADEIAPIVRLLAGPGGTYITGQTFVVDGGLST
jgi:3-oxoacyl-[acyl-carrier protein] reductase